MLRGPSESVELLQTEEAQYKLDGLILVIAGVGRTKSRGQPVLQAFGIISYDDESATYRMAGGSPLTAWHGQGAAAFGFKAAGF